MSESSIGAMIDAIDVELQEIKKRGSIVAVDLHAGQRVNKMGNETLYRFNLTEDILLRDDSPIRLTVSGEQVDGTIVSLRQGELIVSLSRDLGPVIRNAKLISDQSFLLERLRDKLSEIRGNSSGFNCTKAKQTIGEGDIKVSPFAVGSDLTSRDLALNNEQIESLAKALGSDVTYIWGPPGTGKTTVLARIVEGFYKLGFTVLVVSNTNVAVDTIMEKVGDRLCGEDRFQEGLVIRFGPIAKEELKRKYGQQMIIENVVQRVGRRLIERKRQIAEHKFKLKSQARHLRETVELFERWLNVAEHRRHLEREVHEYQAKTKKIAAAVSANEQRIAAYQNALERSMKMGTIRRVLYGLLNPRRLEEQISKAKQEQSELRQSLSSLRRKAKDLIQNLERKQEEFKLLKQNLTSSVSCPHCKEINRVPPLIKKERLICGRCHGKFFSHRMLTFEGRKDCLKSLHERVDRLNAEIVRIDKQLEDIRNSIIGNCKIVGTTVYRTYLKGQVERTFDAVVIDEASMLLLPMVYYAAGLASQRVVVAGDFRQLPPIVISRERIAQLWLKRDVFHKAGIAVAVKSGARPKALAALRIQYRMNEDICSNLLNEVFYPDHPLETAPWVRERPRQSVPFGSSCLLYADTASCEPWAAVRLGTFSRYNILHAVIIISMMLRAQALGYLPPERGTNELLGIVSPYKAQTTLIRQLIQDRLDRRGAEFAGTVHSYQGNEKEMIIIDITDSLGVKPSVLIRASEIEEDGSRLLNVAVSRARQCILLVANFRYLRGKLPARCYLRRILDIFQERGQSINCQELLSLGGIEWLNTYRATAQIDLPYNTAAAGIFSETSFYPAFARDLVNARKSIVIFTPFITPQGAARWIEILRAKANEGVAVRVVTRPPSEGIAAARDTQEMINSMRNIGIAVDLRSKQHEKLAVVDDSILWHGSLNVFSHRDTSESMLRIESPAACAKIAEFLSAKLMKSDEEQEGAPIFAYPENPDCSEGHGVMVLKRGRYGIFFECTVCRKRISLRRATRKQSADGQRHA